MSGYASPSNAAGRMLARDNPQVVGGSPSNRVLRSQTKASPLQSQQQQVPYLNSPTGFHHDTSASYLPDATDANNVDNYNMLNSTSGDRKPSLQSPSKPFHLMNSARLYNDF
ncbi:uncharacterized protein RHIMIDRAFT_310799 [Rhizopus microsporus ATCC 52813]|uniref:Uncharacterized protein n=1 Tax=Rhizopus microsporus ATCC 52813 TaxID=1340429 RepID=A0A2G4T5C6_RHIZD|nr:uncharacterized protein RHIMIDRAFT_310799 [Rhizopus microsporus ATCC 52813]PHZ16210.1 hypothetical protein RHIMIDRAFT_310799 [Rhizopus microsporus ATCC 52813]